MGILDSFPAGEVCSTAWALERKSGEEGSSAKRRSQGGEVDKQDGGDNYVSSKVSGEIACEGEKEQRSAKVQEGRKEERHECSQKWVPCSITGPIEIDLVHQS